MKNPKQLEHFSYEYRRLLNQVQAAHGHRCKVFILPAVPVSIAVECGRVLLPTKDPDIFACEYYDEDGVSEGSKNKLRLIELHTIGEKMAKDYFAIKNRTDLTKERARAILPILVRQAMACQKIKVQGF